MLSSKPQAEVDDLISDLCCGFGRTLRTRDAARDRNQHSVAILAKPCLKHRLQLSALRTNTGGEKPQVRCCGTDLLHRFDMRCPNDETDIIFRVPLLCEMGHMHVQR